MSLEETFADNFAEPTTLHSEEAPTTAAEPAQDSESAPKQSAIEYWTQKFMNKGQDAAANPATTAKQGLNETLISEPAPAKEPDLILGKFKTHDDLIKSYTELEKLNTRLAQRHGLPEGVDNVKAYMEQVQQEIQRLERLKAESEYAQLALNFYRNQAQGDSPPQQQGQSQEELSNEELADLLITDPAKVLKMFEERAERIAQAKIDALQQARIREEQEYQRRVENWQRQYRDMLAIHPDIKDMVDDIDKVITERPYLENIPDGLLIAYNLVKAQKGPQITPEMVLNNQEIKNKLLADEGIRQEIIKSYVANVRTGTPPVVIGHGGGGLPPAASKAEIKSVADATKAAADFFRSRIRGSN